MSDDPRWWKLYRQERARLLPGKKGWSTIARAEAERDENERRYLRERESYYLCRGKLQAAQQAADEYRIRLDRAELALREIEDFCTAHLPFASEKSEVIARRVGGRARAALPITTEADPRPTPSGFDAEAAWRAGGAIGRAVLSPPTPEGGAE